MGWIHSWFGVDVNKWVVVALGALVFQFPLARMEMYKPYTFRLLTLSSVLIWVVIFNHKAESPTFIIAMTGAAWWFVLAVKNVLNTAPFVCCFILTSLSPTDPFPALRPDRYAAFALPIAPSLTYPLLLELEVLPEIHFPHLVIRC